jgi:alpha-L-fucosidase 2
MLIQSQNGIIELLPALPKAWASKGHFYGLKARGNWTVDIEWENGKVNRYRVVGTSKVRPAVKVHGKDLIAPTGSWQKVTKPS